MRRSYLHAALLLPLLALAQIQLTQAQTGYPDTHPAANTEPGSRPDLVRYDQDTVLVKFKPGAPAAEQGRAHQQVSGQVVKELNFIGVQLVRVPTGTVEAAINAYRKNPNVTYAEPNYSRLLFLPVTSEGSEPSLGIANNFTEQWGLDNTGQGFGATVDPIWGTITTPGFYGTPDADIDAPEGWGTDRTGDANVAIAVLDSGVACDHLDLAGKCIEERNFVAAHNATLEDVLGHGTHVAGIAAASTDNDIGIAGVGWNSRIGAMKVCWEDTSLAPFGVVVGQCDDADVAAAIGYVVSSGLYKVINMSLAGPEFSNTLQSAVDSAWNAGIVVVAGAGNAYSTDIMYPAGYSSVIAVGATDHHDNLASYSTFGPWVDVLAPGSNLVSTVPGAFCGQAEGVPSDCYDWKSGTSMATPMVAGLAALLWAHQTSPTSASVRSAIEDTAEATGAREQNMRAWSRYGRINMNAALNAGSGGNGGGGTDPQPVTHTVASISIGTVNAGRGSKYGQVQVNIVDNLGNPVAGATVAGTFSDPFGESVSADTNASGAATLQTSTAQKGGFTFTFCVDNVTAADTVYEPASPGGDCASF